MHRTILQRSVTNSIANLERTALGGVSPALWDASGIWGWQDGRKSSFSKNGIDGILSSLTPYSKNTDNVHICSLQEKCISVHARKLVFKCIFWWVLLDAN